MRYSIVQWLVCLIVNSELMVQIPAIISIQTIHCWWEGGTVKERTGHTSSYAETIKMKSLRLLSNGRLRATIRDCWSSSKRHNKYPHTYTHTLWQPTYTHTHAYKNQYTCMHIFRGVVLRKKLVDTRSQMYVKHTKWMISYKQVCKSHPPQSTPDYTPVYIIRNKQYTCTHTNI